MSEVDPKNPSGNPDPASGNDPGKKDVVSYDTYSKLLGEKKAKDARLAELEAEAETRKQEALKAQGKYQDLATEWETKAKEAIANQTKQAKAMATRLFHTEVKSVASLMGAKKEALEDIIKVGNWTDAEVNLDDFSVDQAKIKTSLEQLQKDKPYFFGQEANAPRTTTPSNTTTVVMNGSVKPLDSLSMDELKELARNAK